MKVDDDESGSITAAEMVALDIGDAPLIPWNWKNRAYDNAFTAGSGNTTDSPSTAFNIINKTSNHIGLEGFVRSFSSTFSGAEYPSVSFTMEFEEATVIADNFFD